MTIFNQIIQKWTAKIEQLAQKGENNNGKIDTHKELNELGYLLAGAKEEIGDLLRLEKNKLNPDFLTKREYDTQETSLEIAAHNAFNAIDNSGSSLTVEDGEVYRTRKGGSYEQILKDSQNAFVVTIKSKEGNEIGRKAYNKARTHIYTNKYDVANKCGLFTKNSIEDMKPGAIKKFFEKILPSRLSSYERSFMEDPVAKREFNIETLNHLNDDEAVDFESGLLYKWNPKKNEYEKVGSIEKYTYEYNPPRFYIGEGKHYDSGNK